MASTLTVVGLSVLLAACGSEEGATGEAFDLDVIGGTTAAEVGGSQTSVPGSSSGGIPLLGTTFPASSAEGASLDTTGFGTRTETGEPEENSTGVERDCPRVQVNLGVGLTESC